MNRKRKERRTKTEMIQRDKERKEGKGEERRNSE
jgi:hypothetical protein